MKIHRHVFFLLIIAPVEIENLFSNDKKSKVLSIGKILKLCMSIEQIKKNNFDNSFLAFLMTSSNATLLFLAKFIQVFCIFRFHMHFYWNKLLLKPWNFPSDFYIYLTSATLVPDPYQSVMLIMSSPCESAFFQKDQQAASTKYPKSTFPKRYCNQRWRNYCL